MRITKQLTKKYCHFVVFSLALALAAPFLSCRSGGGGDGDGNQGPGVPSVPQNFKAENPSDSDGPITLTWDPVAGEGVTYDLFFSETREFTLEDGTKIPDVTSPYIHENLMDGTTYYYRLTAANASGTSEPTAEISAITPPATPQNFMATALNQQVTLTWDVLSGLTYDLYYSTTQGFTLASGTEIAGVTQPYTHTGLTNDTTYYYRLTATNASGMSEPTDEISAITPPATPQNFMATALSQQVTLTWDVLSGLTYDLYYSTTQGFTLASGTEIAGVTQPYTHTGLTNNTTYYYLLTAANASGTSEPTDEISAITPPATPQNFMATALSQQVTLTWDVLSGLTYDLYYSTTQGFTLASGTEIAGVTQPYTHTGLTNNTTYYYLLTAANASGTSEPTDEVSATPGIPIAILYQAVDGTTTTFQGNFGFGLCDESKAPNLLKASQGYTGHTFYGSRTGTNGNFNQLPQRLGGANPGTREMRLWRRGATSLHTPTTATTLSELIALSSGNYTNTTKVRPIFRWMQHGNEATSNSNYRYWSFTNTSGGFSSSNSCFNASLNSIGNGVHSVHDSTNSITSPFVTCNTSLAVLCLARRN